MNREERLLARILESLREPAPAAGASGAVAPPEIGPGDDAAVLSSPDGGRLLLTVDAAEDGVHFDRALHSPEEIGRRAMAAAASDLAAMGGRPLGFLLSLVVPAGGPNENGAEDDAAFRVARAAGRRASEIGAPVVGGNLSAGARLALQVTAAGRMAPGVPPLRRSGARPGDGVFVSGPLGGGALGLEALRARRNRRGAAIAGGSAEEEDRVRKHLDPEPRLALGEALAASGAASAAMDLSDGLALDLHRLAEASGVGALLEIERIPVFPGEIAPVRALEAALFGGEDYELLFTGADEAALAEAAGESPPIRIGAIGAPERGVRIRRVGGGVEPLPRRGWDSLAPSR